MLERLKRVFGLDSEKEDEVHNLENRLEAERQERRGVMANSLHRSKRLITNSPIAHNLTDEERQRELERLTDMSETFEGRERSD